MFLLSRFSIGFCHIYVHPPGENQACFSKKTDWFVNFSGGSPLPEPHCSQDWPRHRRQSDITWDLPHFLSGIQRFSHVKYTVLQTYHFLFSYMYCSLYLWCLSFNLENSLSTFKVQLKCYLFHGLFWCPRQLVMSFSRFPENSIQISFLSICFVIFKLFVYIYVLSKRLWTS